MDKYIICQDITNVCLPQEKEIFKQSVDPKYQAICLLGKQVVAGLNYLFLAYKINDPYNLYAIKIYKNLQHKTSLSSITEIDPEYFCKKQNKDDKEMTGAFRSDDQIPNILIKEQNILNKALENKNKVYYHIALLAKKAETDYLFLTKTFNEKEKPCFVVINVHQDLNNFVSIIGEHFIEYADLLRNNKNGK